MKRFSEVFEGYIEIDDRDIEPFSMKQLKRPVFFVLSLYGMAMMVFLAEIVIYKWKLWRERKIDLLWSHDTALVCPFFCHPFQVE